MTKEQIEYIRKNRLKESMYNMAAELDISYNKVRDYMIANNLQLTKEELREMKCYLYSNN